MPRFSVSGIAKVTFKDPDSIKGRDIVVSQPIKARQVKAANPDDACRLVIHNLNKNGEAHEWLGQPTVHECPTLPLLPVA